MNFNNLFLHSLRKSHYIRPFTSQAVANSALRSKRLATPVLEGKKHLFAEKCYTKRQISKSKEFVTLPFRSPFLHPT